MEQPYFQRVCVGGPMPVCDDVSARMMVCLCSTPCRTMRWTRWLHACSEVIAAEQDRRRPRQSRDERHVPQVYGRMSRATGEIAVE